MERCSALAIAATLASLAACGHEWDAFDPRNGAGGADGGITTSTGGSPPTSTSSASGGDGGAAATGGASSTGGSGGATTGGGDGGTGGGIGGSSSGGAPATGDCSSPFVAADPSTQQNDTTGQGDEVDPSCTPGGAEDVVYQVIPAVTGVLDIVLTSDADLVIHVRFDCDDPNSEIDCEDDQGTFDDPEVEKVLVEAGQPIYVIVDGYEPGRAAPFTLDVSSHPLVCGDSIVDPGEACDPPNGVSCDPNCGPYPEDCADGADNDLDELADCEDVDDCPCMLGPQCNAATPLGPTVMGDTSPGTGDFAGSCVGNPDIPEVLYSYTPPQTGVLVLALDSAEDLGMYARTSCTDPSSETFCVDIAGGGSIDDYALPVVAGQPFTLFVDGFTQSDVGTFTLDATLFPSTEGEPNEDASQAAAVSGTIVGSSYPAGDEDWFTVSIPGASSTLTVTVLDFGTGNCSDDLLESELWIYDTDASTQLDYDDNGGNGDCSIASASGLAAGTYYVRLRSPAPFGWGGTFGYQLELLIN